MVFTHLLTKAHRITCNVVYYVKTSREAIFMTKINDKRR